jgi:predicted helicase
LTLAPYLKAIENELSAGRATEHTHRPALKTLVESLGSGITATNEPKRVECGAPDYIVTKGQIPLGYIEAKDVGVSLDNAEKGEQLGRYRGSLGNLILTDYLEFRWYVRPERTKANDYPTAQHRLTARIASVGKNGKLRLEKNGEAEVLQLLDSFLAAQVPTVQSAKELATRMAKLAQLIRDIIRKALSDEEAKGTLHQQMEGFREVLIHDLTEEQFADMYAQTICYGLFAARCNAKGSEHFTREHAAYDLPKTNPFLRKMFNHIAGPELDERIAWAVDDLAELLHRTRISDILADFGKSTRREDPVVHFYETFLAAYDSKMREARGVYYTPEPVVSYIVRSIDHILKTDFKLAQGLADSSKITIKSPDGNGTTDVHKVLILDPATGTGTFLYGVINHIFESFKKNLGMWSGYVSDQLLPRLFGFELLMAPYAVAHMKLGLLLDQLGYDFKTDERLRVYLTNTLEEAHESSKMPLFTQWLAQEANEASKIKEEKPVMVVLGNPPYSGESMNKGDWIRELIQDYMYVDGKHLGEKGKKNWLQDDYVKFIRFAQWRIEETGYGALSLITNHAYLDNPTFRGMRQSLMQTFDDIYVLDLHGSSKKKERPPDGSEDKNVFDIQQGVAISIFVKRGGAKKKIVKVNHADLWGLREIYDQDVHGERVLTGGKYHWLWTNDISSTEWFKLKPQSPFYFFVPQNTELLGEYEQGWKITDMMPLNGAGIITARDHFAIDFEDQPLRKRLELFRDPRTSDEWITDNLKVKDNSMWSMSKARVKFRQGPIEERLFTDLYYRPFDVRRTYYDTNIVFNMRRQTMGQMLSGKNLGLITSRMTKGETFRHAQVTRNIIEVICMSPKTSNNGFLFPLYLYSETVPNKLFDNSITGTIEAKRPNFAPEFITDLSSRLKMTFISNGKGDGTKTFGPEDVFDYVYTVFHSPTYRSRYAEFLKSDFPRLPLTSNAELFRSLCTLGSELVGLHLMEKHASTITTYPIAGENKVDKVRYTSPGEGGSEQGRVWINREQYFEGVPLEVWNFYVGGYQVC